jgi:hypothetical protein
MNQSLHPIKMSSGITKAKSTCVVHDLKEFTEACVKGTVKIEVEPHETRSKKLVYFVKADVMGEKNRVYFALPKGANVEELVEEKPKLILKIAKEDGKYKDPAFEQFETDYKEFMRLCIEPLLKPLSNTTSELKLANFSKSDGDSSKFTILQLPRGIKTDLIKRLIEAKGSHLLISISYMYLLDDKEKGHAYYGGIFECGRYPFIPSSGKPPKSPASKKRERHDTESDLPESKSADTTEEKVPASSVDV